MDNTVVHIPRNLVKRVKEGVKSIFLYDLGEFLLPDGRKEVLERFEAGKEKLESLEKTIYHLRHSKGDATALWEQTLERKLECMKIDEQKEEQKELDKEKKRISSFNKVLFGLMFCCSTGLVIDQTYPKILNPMIKGLNEFKADVAHLLNHTVSIDSFQEYLKDEEYVQNNPDIFIIKDGSKVIFKDQNYLRLARKAKLDPDLALYLYNFRNKKGKRMFDAMQIIQAQKAGLTKEFAQSLYYMNQNLGRETFSADEMILAAKKNLRFKEYLYWENEHFSTKAKYLEFEKYASFIHAWGNTTKKNRVTGTDIIDAFERKINLKYAQQLLVGVRTCTSKQLIYASDKKIKKEKIMNLHYAGCKWITDKNGKRKLQQPFADMTDILDAIEKGVTPSYAKQCAQNGIERGADIIFAKELNIDSHDEKALELINMGKRRFIEIKRHKGLNYISRESTLYKELKKFGKFKKDDGRILFDQKKDYFKLWGRQITPETIKKFMSFTKQYENRLFNCGQDYIHLDSYKITPEFVKKFLVFTNHDGKTMFNDAHAYITLKNNGIKPEFVKQFVSLKKQNGKTLFEYSGEYVDLKKNNITPEFVKEYLPFKEKNGKTLFDYSIDYVILKREKITPEFVKQFVSFTKQDGNALFHKGEDYSKLKAHKITPEFVKQFLVFKKQDGKTLFDEALCYEFLKEFKIKPEYVKQFVSFKRQDGKTMFDNHEDYVELNKCNITPEEVKQYLQIAKPKGRFIIGDLRYHVGLIRKKAYESKTKEDCNAIKRSKPIYFKERQSDFLKVLKSKFIKSDK